MCVRVQSSGVRVCIVVWWDGRREKCGRRDQTVVKVVQEPCRARTREGEEHKRDRTMKPKESQDSKGLKREKERRMRGEGLFVPFAYELLTLNI